MQNDKGFLFGAVFCSLAALLLAVMFGVTLITNKGEITLLLVACAGLSLFLLGIAFIYMFAYHHHANIENLLLRSLDEVPYRLDQPPLLQDEASEGRRYFCSLRDFGAGVNRFALIFIPEGRNAPRGFHREENGNEVFFVPDHMTLVFDANGSEFEIVMV